MNVLIKYTYVLALVDLSWATAGEANSASVAVGVCSIDIAGCKQCENAVADMVSS